MTRTFIFVDPDDAWPQPTSHTIGEALRRTKQTSPGPDGIPYDGWRASGPAAWAAISTLGIHIAGGYPVPATWGESRTVFCQRGLHPTTIPGSPNVGDRQRTHAPSL